MKTFCAFMMLVVLGIVPSFCSIFFDDFDGDSLKSHWYVDKESYLIDWEYSVEDSWLNVWNVWGPGSQNFVKLVTLSNTFPIQKNDFDVRARVAWDQGEFQTLTMAIGVYGASTIAMAYVARPDEDPYISVRFDNWGGGSAKIPAPSSGIHEYRIARAGTTLTAYFDGEKIYQAYQTEGYGYELKNVNFTFGGPKGYGNPQFAPLYVDWVAVVPEPSTIAACGFGFMFVFIRKLSKAKK